MEGSGSNRRGCRSREREKENAKEREMRMRMSLVQGKENARENDGTKRL